VKGHPPKTIRFKPRKNSFKCTNKKNILQLIALSKNQQKKRKEKVSSSSKSKEKSSKYRVNRKVSLSLGPSLSLQTLFHPQFQYMRQLS
jgi:hypothetical protein